MNPKASPAELRDWIAGHLDPVDSEPSRPANSDFDLNPMMNQGQPIAVRTAAVLVPLVERRLDPAGDVDRERVRLRVGGDDERWHDVGRTGLEPVTDGL